MSSQAILIVLVKGYEYFNVWESCLNTTYSTLRGQIKGTGRDCICARVHPL